METKKNEYSTKQTCENCRYYLQHYIKRDMKYIRIFCGHCINTDAKKFKRKPHELCGYWDEMAIQKLERKQTIKKAIIWIAKSLDELTAILKDDMNDCDKLPQTD